MPTTAEVRGWSRLVAGVADQVVVGTVQDVHRAVIASTVRWFGPLARPLDRYVSTVTDGAYGALRTTLRAAGEIGAATAGHLGTDDVPPSPAATKARAIAHGVVGEHLMALSPELDLEVTLRRDGVEVAPTPDGLAATYPDASGRITVFVHGLVDTEAVWSTPVGEGPPLPSLAASLGATPVLVRYGTGRAIARNGADLAELLQQLIDRWPVPVTELTIVGHSMGGLLARAACATAARRDHTWTETLTDVIYLGSPHLGSWLEKASNVATWVLRQTSPITAPIGALIDGRSRGIKDLRFGTLVDDAYDADDIDDLLTGLVPDDPWLDGVTHHLVAGRLRPNERHPFNVTLGDAFVRSSSAAGAGRRRRIGDGGDVTLVPVSSRHADLVRAPEVATLLADVLGPEPVRG
jgi:pimeloyl-ACP methyl ester carboxylesterase